MQNLLLIIAIFIAILALFPIAMHIGFRAPRNRETKTPADFDLPFSEHLIPSISDKKLFAWLLTAENSKETLIILHGWGSNSEWMLPVAKPFYHAGINVLLIDSRNHGNSDADSFSSLPRFAEDIDKAIDWLKLNHIALADKIAILGHSVGGGAALFSASKRDDIQAIISISAFAHPKWMMQRFLKKAYLPAFIIPIILRYIEWVIGHSFASIAPIKTVCDITKPILLVHGKDDTTVPIEDAHAIIKNCPKSHLQIIEVDGAGHNSVDKVEQHSEELIDFLYQSGFRKASL